MSCGGGCRRGSDPMLLWLWHRPEAATPIRPLAWEPPYAAGVALEKARKNKTKNCFWSSPELLVCFISISVFFKILLYFPLTFFFKSVVKKSVISFSYMSQFSSFPPVTEFQFHILVVRKDTWYDFSLFKFAKNCFVTSHMIFPGECFVRA